MLVVKGASWPVLIATSSRARYRPLHPDKKGVTKGSARELAPPPTRGTRFTRRRLAPAIRSGHSLPVVGNQCDPNVADLIPTRLGGATAQ